METFFCFPHTFSIEKCYATTQQIAKQTKPIETKVREQFLQIVGFFLGGALLGDFPELLFLLA